jgi:hypothetical protein
VLEREKQQEGNVPSSHISNRSPSLIGSQPPMSVHVEGHPRSSRPKTRSRPIPSITSSSARTIRSGSSKCTTART